MKTIIFGLAIALATPVVASAAETPAKPCCCKEKKDGCCEEKGEEKPEHKDMQH
jgi:hypothetical protein